MKSISQSTTVTGQMNLLVQNLKNIQITMHVYASMVRNVSSHCTNSQPCQEKPNLTSWLTFFGLAMDVTCANDNTFNKHI